MTDIKQVNNAYGLEDQRKSVNRLHRRKLSVGREVEKIEIAPPRIFVRKQRERNEIRTTDRLIKLKSKS